MLRARLRIHNTVLESWPSTSTEGVHLRCEAGSASPDDATATTLTPELLIPEYLMCNGGDVQISEQLEGSSDAPGAWKAAALLRLIARAWVLAQQGLSGEAGEAIVASRILHSRIRHLPGSLFGQAALFRGFLWAYLNSFTSMQADELLRIVSGTRPPDADDPMQALLAASETRLHGNVQTSLSSITEDELARALATGQPGVPARVVGLHHHYWYDSVMQPILQEIELERTRRLAGSASSASFASSTTDARARLSALRFAVRREPDNPHDPHAMLVTDAHNGRRVGYLRSRLASVLTRVVDLDEELSAALIAVPSRPDAAAELHIRLSSPCR